MSFDFNYPHFANLSHAVADNPLQKEALARYHQHRFDIDLALKHRHFARLNDLINDYRLFIDQLENVSDLDNRAKLYSSFLEEMMVTLFRKDIELAVNNDPYLSSLNFYVGSHTCTVRVHSDFGGNYAYETKDIDFAICIVKDDDSKIMLFGIEAKKYMDKNMYAAYKMVHDNMLRISPRSFYGFVVEHEARELTDVPFSETFGKEFILTDFPRNKSVRYPFASDRLKYFITTCEELITQHLKLFSEGHAQLNANIEIKSERRKKNAPKPPSDQRGANALFVKPYRYLVLSAEPELPATQEFLQSLLPLVIEATDHEESDSTLF